MNVVLLLLTLVPFGICLNPYTYWIDASCDRLFGERFQRAFNDARTWAQRGADKLAISDTLQEEYFRRFFAPAGDPVYNTRVEDVTRQLGHPFLTPGISGMIPEPNNDRRKANYRYYCDNDPQDPRKNSTTRWKLRSDVPKQYQHSGYIPQQDRPPWAEHEFGQPYQEFEDRDNGMLMGAGTGCQSTIERLPQGVTYTLKRPGRPPPGQPEMRATITICNVLFKHISRPDLASLEQPVVSLLPVYAISSLPTYTILHEACHLPPWNGVDYSWGASEEGWSEIQNLRIGQKMVNPDNYVYFSLVLATLSYKWPIAKTPKLARLSDPDRALRLSPDEQEARAGTLANL
ncbi:MAG: hypothetical protein Q9227_005692 [Pyrenula ochraceoflavens]